MRVRRVPGAYEALLKYDRYFIPEPERFKGSWQSVFGNDKPLYAEFGGGKGKFIIEIATRYPEINFIMVDAVTEILLKAAQRSYKHQLPNLRIIQMDLQFARNVFSDGELDRIYLNFSDPWPKKRHFKRRLTYRDFLETYRYLLKKGEWVHFKTDNRDLFEFSLNEFASLDLKMKNISLNLHANEPVDNVKTEYEEKFSSLGHPIYRVEVSFRE